MTKKMTKYIIKANDQFYGTYTTSSEKALDKWCRNKSNLWGINYMLYVYNENNELIAKYFTGCKVTIYEEG